MKSLLLSLFLVTFYTPQIGLTYVEDVYEISPSHKVTYRYQAPKKGKPTLVLLNGLIWSLDNWNDYIESLSKKGYGLLITAYSTQPESLFTLDPDVPPYFSKMEISYWGPKQVGIKTQDLIDETIKIIDYLKIEKFSLLSLSYGSIVASEMAVQYKDRIKELILVAPAMMTSGRYNPYGASRHAYYSLLKASGNVATDYYYDLEIYNTLMALLVSSKYQVEGVKFTNFFDGVYQMARSSKWFDLKDYAKADLPDTYLFLASEEDGSLFEDQKSFWSMMKENPARKSLVVFQGSYHAIPGIAPEEAALWTSRALEEKIKNEEVEVIVEMPKDVPSSKKTSFIGTTGTSGLGGSH